VKVAASLTCWHTGGYVDRIVQGLWIGDLHDLATLPRYSNDEHKISAILSCVEHNELFFLNRPEVARSLGDRKHVILPMQDGCPVDPAIIGRAVETLHEWHFRRHTTLVHCAAGISRSPSMVIAYLMRHYKVDWDEAERWVREGRPIIMPHTEIKKSILQYFKLWPYDGSLGTDHK